jgi:hypothetical protein
MVAKWNKRCLQFPRVSFNGLAALRKNVPTAFFLELWGTKESAPVRIVVTAESFSRELLFSTYSKA